MFTKANSLLFLAVFFSFYLPLDLSAAISASPSLNESDLAKIEQEVNNKSLSKESLQALLFIVERYPDSGKAHILLGNCCDAMGLPEQAMEQYKLAFKYNPNNIQSILELIKAQLRAGQTSAASCLLKQAIKRFSADPQVLFLTGQALYKERRFDEARQLYAQAIDKSKKPITGINSAMGELSLLERQYNNALSLAMADLAVDADMPQANEIAGTALFKLGQYERAIPYLKVAFKNSPNNFSLAYSYIQALIWCGKYNDSFFPLIVSLANYTTQLEKNRLEKAILYVSPHLSKKTIRQTVEEVSHSRFNGSELVHTELAAICLQKNIPDLALSEYLLADRLNPNSAQTKYCLAIVLEEQKRDYTGALSYLRAAKALDPYKREVNLRLMRLEDRMNVKKSDWAWLLKDWLT